jgi:hypothetical protein
MYILVEYKGHKKCIHIYTKHTPPQLSIMGYEYRDVG